MGRVSFRHWRLSFDSKDNGCNQNLRWRFRQAGADLWIIFICAGPIAGKPAPTGFSTGLQACAVPVGAGLPAIGPAQPTKKPTCSHKSASIRSSCV
ncbi:hypothetical protein DVB73_16870 [Pseudomonas plecoglossicida]|uniref:Uncharacterized protein n=1 Tax=Pseudomonas plecoglossicida TaxID=70775 RepID=A0AAD0QX61_PSEDL|nr:hypothetical protein DVB73_16870 [Pseudomonas plecoglossicida]